MLDPEILKTFQELWQRARDSSDPEPTAMTLATVGESGRVAARTVLLKGVDARGFRFFTNYHSAKGRQLAAHPQVALSLLWKALGESHVQVRVEGRAEHLGEEESDAYFATRPRPSQLGAWASLQSETLPDRSVFAARLAAVEERFAGRSVTRPPHWGGVLVVPDRVEFWYGVRHRLHQRVLWERLEQGWTRRLLYP